MIKKISLDWDPIKILNIFGFKLSIYSILFFISFLLGIKQLKYFYKIDEQKIDYLIKSSLLGLLIGARIGHVLFYDLFYFKTNLLEAIFPIKNYKYIGYQGLSSHGAAIGLLISTFFYNKKFIKKQFFWLCDRLCIIIAWSGSLIRIGNFFNSEINGKKSNFAFPFSIGFIQLYQDKIFKIKRYPSQLYESISYIIIYKILFFLYKKNKNNGYIFSIFLLCIWSIRFLLEFLKEPQPNEMLFLFKLNTGQLLSIPFLIIGFLLLFKNKLKTII
ncbi:MAG: prolipoprotein diacylglyceryl transferase [Candidatus Karelsulcia muelleri]|nr:MAG: prolipoprotein diacylglyceryl transferase [Candidatus Karelsulcia muelleri]